MKVHVRYYCRPSRAHKHTHSALTCCHPSLKRWRGGPAAILLIFSTVFPAFAGAAPEPLPPAATAAAASAAAATFLRTRLGSRAACNTRPCVACFSFVAGSYIFFTAQWPAHGEAGQVALEEALQEGRAQTSWSPLVQPAPKIDFCRSQLTSPRHAFITHDSPKVGRGTAHLWAGHGGAAVVGQAVALGLRPCQRPKQLRRLQAVSVPDVR